MPGETEEKPVVTNHGNYITVTGPVRIRTVRPDRFKGVFAHYNEDDYVPEGKTAGDFPASLDGEWEY